MYKLTRREFLELSTIAAATTVTAAPLAFGQNASEKENVVKLSNPFDDNLAGTFLALNPTLWRNKYNAALVAVPGTRHPANPVLERGGPGTHSESRVAFPHVRVEDGRFRMWYMAGDGRFLKYGGGPLGKFQNSYEGMWLCYAESDDGIRWTQPKLGLYEFNGSKQNNIIGRGACPSFLFDPADPAPERRYKCVFDWFDKKTPFSMYSGTSPDGIHWKYDFTRSPHESMECPNLHRWGEQICAMVQVFDPLVRTPDPGGMARRVNALFTSRDFKHWQRVPGLAFQVPRQDPMRPGFNRQCHMGPTVYNAGRFGIGIYGRFIAPSSDQTNTRVSLGLILTDDGRHFFEPFADFDLLPRPEDDRAWDAHMLGQPAGPSLVQVGDQWWVYYKGSRGGNVWNGVPAIGIATWRKHGFAYFTTLHRSCPTSFQMVELKIPAKLTGISINAVVPKGGGIRIAMSTSAGGFRGTLTPGDGTALPVQWDRAIPWQKLAGQKARLKFELAGPPHKVRLYAWRLEV